MSLFKRKTDIITIDGEAMVVTAVASSAFPPHPEVQARVADNGREIAVAFSGWGQGGHSGSLRAVGNGVDRTTVVQWDGDTYMTSIEGGAEEVIAKIDRKSERIAPVVPLGR